MIKNTSLFLALFLALALCVESPAHSVGEPIEGDDENIVWKGLKWGVNTALDHGPLLVTTYEMCTNPSAEDFLMLPLAAGYSVAHCLDSDAGKKILMGAMLAAYSFREEIGLAMLPYEIRLMDKVVNFVGLQRAFQIRLF